MTETNERLDLYRRNEKLEALLTSLAIALDEVARPPLNSSERPALFVVGPPRTGSTYCMQWLAGSGAFTYPSNFIARFWTAPFIGAMIQEMIATADFNYRGEFSDILPDAVKQSSDVGKTTGMLSPNEFWYFWRQHFPEDGNQGLVLSDAHPRCYHSFRSEIARLCDVSGKPVAMKGKIINHQITPFAEHFDKALILFMDRDPVDSAWSLLQARRRIYGDEGRWWSFRTPDYKQLIGMPPLEQAVGQVQSIRRDVLQQLSELPAHRWLRLEYEELCADPDASYARVKDLFAANGLTLEGDNVMPCCRPSKRLMDAETLERLEQALTYFPV